MALCRRGPGVSPTRLLGDTSMNLCAFGIIGLVIQYVLRWDTVHEVLIVASNRSCLCSSYVLTCLIIHDFLSS
jgi:hypothetical protein